MLVEVRLNVPIVLDRTLLVTFLRQFSARRLTMSFFLKKGRGNRCKRQGESNRDENEHSQQRYSPACLATGGRPHPGLYGDGCHRRTVCPGTPRQSHLSCHPLRGPGEGGGAVTFFHAVSHRVCASGIISQTWHHPTYPGTCCHCLFLPCFVSG